MSVTLLSIAVVAVTPLLLAVIGELVLQKSGIINIGLEGMLLLAALSAVVFAQASGSVVIGFAGGIIGAAVAGTIFGVVAITLRSDQIVTGAAVNFVALGLTGLLYRELGRAIQQVERAPSLGRWEVPALADLPILGQMFFRYDPVVAFAWIAAPMFAAALLWRTRTGLRLRACGEYPQAVTAAGLSVERHQWLALSIETLFAGIGGAYLSLALSPGFAENMVAGRGFIALAIVVFSRWTAAGAVGGVALFGVTAAAQYALQATLDRFPFHLLLALPYVVTLCILALAGGMVRPPEYLARSPVERE